MSLIDALQDLFDGIEDNDVRVNIGILNSEIGIDNDGITARITRPTQKQLERNSIKKQALEMKNDDHFKDAQPIDYANLTDDDE